jgi:transposase
MQFEQAYDGWKHKRLTQEDAASLLNVCPRTFRRYINRYDDEGMSGLIDKRLSQVSQHRAPVDEVMALEALYRDRYDSWNIKHFHERYQGHHEGTRSYTWVKQQLQVAGLAKKGKRRGPHRIRRERKPLPGMMIHQDASTHAWVPDQMWDLIITMDDATSEIYSAFFVEEEGTWSSLGGVRDTLEAKGLFSSFYSDRGSHYWHTPDAGGKVDKTNPTQFGRAMKELGIGMIAAYSPEARGRSERMFGTWQGRLPNELALHKITDMDEANRFIASTFLPEINKRFTVEASEQGCAFVPLLNTRLDDILCLKAARIVGNDNCVKYRGKVLQIPKTTGRSHYAKAHVGVHEYLDQRMAVYHGPRLLGTYDAYGDLEQVESSMDPKQAANG